MKIPTFVFRIRFQDKLFDEAEEYLDYLKKERDGIQEVLRFCQYQNKIQGKHEAYFLLNCGLCNLIELIEKIEAGKKKEYDNE